MKDIATMVDAFGLALAELFQQDLQQSLGETARGEKRETAKRPARKKAA